VGLEVDRVVRLTVSDDGVGFEQPATSAAERLGLLSMLERAEAVGGVLRVRSVVGTGTTVVAELPAARAPETGL
jgi:signal transduction histidine kinase